MYRLPIALSFRVTGASLLFAGCTGSVANQSSEPACETPLLRAAYDAAFAWGASGAGGKTADAVTENAGASSPRARCTVTGYRDGLLSQKGGGHHGGGHHGGGHHGGGHHGGDHDLDGGIDPGAQCEDDGTFAGETAAQVFCELSIALGGLGVDDLLIPGTASQCSTAFEAACRAAFDRVTASFEQVSGDPDAHCAPFTTGEFVEAFEVARFNQCLFSLGEPGGPEEPDAGAPSDAGAQPDSCDDGECACEQEVTCELACPQAGCNLACTDGSACTTSCGDGCTTSCRNVTSCALTGESDATLSCEGAEECELEATSGNLSCVDTKRCDIRVVEGADVLCKTADSCRVTCRDCNVQCTDVEHCHVTIEQGSVHCEEVGKCEVECALPGYTAKCKGEGHYVCEKDC